MLPGGCPLQRLAQRGSERAIPARFLYLSATRAPTSHAMARTNAGAELRVRVRLCLYFALCIRCVVTFFRV